MTVLIRDGERRLRDFSRQSYREEVREVAPGVWFVLGMGHSNAVFIEGRTGVLLVDTLDTLKRGEKLRAVIGEKTGKEVKTIFYTHGHPDHRGGAGAFSDSVSEIIAFAPASPALKYSGYLEEIGRRRGERQFGYGLTDEEAISQGIGPREGITHGEHRAFVAPTTLYQQSRVVREIDGVKVELVRLPGEAEDGMMIWLEQTGVLCCGDTYYGCFPNLYAIRGGQYRDIAVWTESLETLRSYPAVCLLPGHTGAVLGRDQVEATLKNFAGAFDYLLTHTLAGMNAGKSAEELAAELVLPAKYAELPYLAEHYGCVEWTIRAIYTAYLGWFDGNPTHLHPLPPAEYAQKTVAMMGGAPAVLQAAQRAAADGEHQWCLELCDLLLDSGDRETDRTVRGQKAAALRAMAALETSANGRHYYLACARELEE